MTQTNKPSTQDFIQPGGIPVDEQRIPFREMGAAPYSKLDDDAFTRVRVILAGAVECRSQLLKQAAFLCAGVPREALAPSLRVEQMQAQRICVLHPADQTPLELAVACEQAAVEITAACAVCEPDPHLAQTFRFVMLENLDHLYRYAALIDRLEGMDANTILQCHTDIRPGRPTVLEHRHPLDELTPCVDARKANPVSLIHLNILTALEQHLCDRYTLNASLCADPLGRMMQAEIAAVKAQHAERYRALQDPSESWASRLARVEATELYIYWSCAQSEENSGIRTLWERFADCERGHLHQIVEAGRAVDPGLQARALMPDQLPEPIPFQGNRDFIRRTLSQEEDLAPSNGHFRPRTEESADSRSAGWRKAMAGEYSPSDLVATHYRWSPGGELSSSVIAQKRQLMKEVFQ